MIDPFIWDKMSPVAAAIIAALVTWILSTAKRKAETGNLIVDAASEAVVAIRAVMDELQEELQDARSDAEALKIANEALREQVEALREEVMALRSILDATKGYPQIGRRAADPALKAS